MEVVSMLAGERLERRPGYTPASAAIRPSVTAACSAR
jgi:hypothetical protein